MGVANVLAVDDFPLKLDASGKKIALKIVYFSNNRAYDYAAYSDCGYMQIMHQYQINGFGPWVWTNFKGTAGNIVYSPTTVNYRLGSECGVTSDEGYSDHSDACPF